MAGVNYTETPFDDGTNLESRLSQVVESIIFKGWSSEMIAQFMAETEATVRAYASGAVIVTEGEPADGMYLITRGSVRLLGLDLELSAPTGIGEAAVLLPLEGRTSFDGAYTVSEPYPLKEKRNATVISIGYGTKDAKTPTELVFLPSASIMDLEATNPTGLICFYSGLMRLAHSRMGEMNAERARLLEENAGLRARLGK